MAQIIINSKETNKVTYELNDLTKHAAVLGTTGSGKTVMCKVLIEEALLKGTPVIAIDPKGDISGLGIHNKKYDFRPFLSNTKSKKVAQNYSKIHEEEAPTFNHETIIYTPKSKVGKQISLMPDLSCPKNFSKIKEYDASTTSTLIEPISDSIVSLANIKTNKDKIQTIISKIIIDSWSSGEDLNLNKLIKKIIAPDFSEIGSLELEDFLKEKDRLKAASSINLLLTSPSKKVWSEGTPLSTSNMLKKSCLNIFDLRFCHSQTEKQFVVEQILQDLYKFLLEKGGSQKLKYILYIDELAGLLPPPPSTPLSKKLLETLIRQARAFGLGIVVATQNPGDIDYKILGNIGSRFIGKLRTDNDVEKVASATENKPSELKTILSRIKTGEFFLNNAFRNKNTKFKSRWVYTFHEGPLTEKEIKWINNPSSKPEVKTTLQHTLNKKINKQRINDDTIIRRGRKAQISEIVLQRETLQKKRKNLKELVKAVKKETDIVTMNVAIGKFQAKTFTPHLKIILEPKPYKNNELKIQGPFLFDLTSKAIPVSNYLSKRTWSQFVPEEIEIETPRASVKQAVNYALKESKQNLRTNFYESKITNGAGADQDVLIESNTKHLEKLAKPKIQRMNQKFEKEIKELESEKAEINKKMKQLRFKTTKKTASRAIKKIFSNKKLLDKTSEMKHWEKRIKQLKNESSKLDKKIFSKKTKHKDELKKLINKIFEKARTQIRTNIFRPKNKDLVIKATILLIPKRPNKK